MKVPESMQGLRVALIFAFIAGICQPVCSYALSTHVLGAPERTLSSSTDTVRAGYYAGTTLHSVDTDLAAGNIKNGVTVFGITGAAAGGGSNPLPDTGQILSYSPDDDGSYNPPASQPSYGDNGDGTITDYRTNLMWKKCGEPDTTTNCSGAHNTYTWANAISQCEGLTFPTGGYSDWRLPNVFELFTIARQQYPGPYVNTTFFPSPNFWYYSSTTYLPDTSKAMDVQTDYPATATGTKASQSLYVRCVRDSGWSGGPPCAQTTISNCVLPVTQSGNSAGTCANCYSGSCSYSCSGTNWSQVSNTCVPAQVQASGGAETGSGSYWMHTFTNDGTLNITSCGEMEVVLVGGGGGGGGGHNNSGTAGGGGAAGTLVTRSTWPTVGNHSIVVGDYGAGGTAGLSGSTATASTGLGYSAPPGSGGGTGWSGGAFYCAGGSYTGSGGGGGGWSSANDQGDGGTAGGNGTSGGYSTCYAGKGGGWDDAASLVGSLLSAGAGGVTPSAGTSYAGGGGGGGVVVSLSGYGDVSASTGTASGSYGTVGGSPGTGWGAGGGGGTGTSGIGGNGADGIVIVRYPAQFCSSTTINNCTMPATRNGNNAGTCANCYSGSCSYSCSGTNWSQVSNTCVPAQAYATGGTVGSSGGYRIHTFNTSGTLSVSTAGFVDVLTVGGGGGGGGNGGGGGGGGQVLYTSSICVSIGNITVTVSTGAAGQVNQPVSWAGTTVFSTITALGGGGGGSRDSNVNGGNGSSGGGGGGNASSGGTGNPGYNGGNGSGNYACASAGGGGGGGGSAGTAGASGLGGTGGNGIANSITGSSVYYGGGGGGGITCNGSGTPGNGTHGGGNGSSTGVGGAGTANRGGGGGGGGPTSNGGAGSSGVVIVRYPSSSSESTMHRTFLTTTGAGTWSVPSDWNASSNTIEAIGGGNHTYYGGGGGGGYSKSINVSLTPSSSVSYFVGPACTNSNSGCDTYFCNSTSNCASIGGTAVVAGAKQGTVNVGSTTGGAGGAAASGVCTGTGCLKYSGGTGGNSSSGQSSGGGGGAAGPYGNGATGGNGIAAAAAHGGGGGGGGGSAGANGVGANQAGNGGNNYLGSGAGTGGAGGRGTAGSAGGGGGGGSGAGGAGTEWDATHGSGGGSGGTISGDCTSCDAGLYGGGGGGLISGCGCGGAQGIVVITYWTY